jgi:hypothetical protein
MVGIPFYCHAYKLLTSKMHGYHAIAIGKGECEQTDLLTKPTKQYCVTLII